MRRLAILAPLLWIALSCRERAEPPPRAPPPQAFTMRDLALATALDARLARLSLVAFEVQTAASEAGAAVRRGAHREKDRARRLLPELRTARAEVEQAVASIVSPADRRLAFRVGAIATSYAEKLAAAVEERCPISVADHVEVTRAQEQLGGEIEVYRRSRRGWRLEGSPRQRVEREFEALRLEMERLEATLASPAESARAAVGITVQRAKAAAGELAPPVAGLAARYASAQEKVLERLSALAGAADERAAQAAGRAYHAAKVDALSALADYYAALSTR